MSACRREGETDPSGLACRQRCGLSRGVLQQQYLYRRLIRQRHRRHLDSVTRLGCASGHGRGSRAGPSGSIRGVGIDLAGRTVLVTGASIGIGRAVALQFAAAGCRLALTYFEHRAEAAEVAERCRGLGAPDVIAVSLQLADDDSIRTLLETVI